MLQGLNARDMGAVDAPLLVFGGSYGNLEATAALIAAAQRLGIPGGRVICTGDVVAYGADPQAVVDLVRSWGCAVVMGNCEESLALDAEDCGCGFSEGSACAVLSAQWFSATRRDLDADARRWMGTLPRRIDCTIAGRRLAAIHGSVSQINQFVFASTDAAEKTRQLDLAGADGILAGHCGVPFTQVIDGRLWHNSGALGMPANDGTPRVWFSVLTPDDDAIAVSHHAIEYDHRAAAEKMRARGYPGAYADALGSGLWPSCDILPAQERALRGHPLAPGHHVWPHRPEGGVPSSQLDIRRMPAV
jgi:predicted phosphodiesterase